MEYIKVDTKSFVPSNPQPQKEILYVCGWALGPSSSVVRRFAKNLADATQTLTTAIATSPITPLQSSYPLEALTLQQHINPNTHITLIGYSQGATKAVQLARQLEDDGQTVDRVFLLSPLSPSHATAKDVVGSFLKESGINAAVAANIARPRRSMQGLRILGGIVGHIVKESRQSFNYPQRLSSEISNMVQANEILQEGKRLRAPITCVVASRDLVGGSMQEIQRLLPQAEIEIVKGRHTHPYFLQRENIDIIRRRVGR